MGKTKWVSVTFLELEGHVDTNVTLHECNADGSEERFTYRPKIGAPEEWTDMEDYARQLLASAIEVL